MKKYPVTLESMLRYLDRLSSEASDLGTLAYLYSADYEYRDEIAGEADFPEWLWEIRESVREIEDRIAIHRKYLEENYNK